MQIFLAEHPELLDVGLIDPEFKAPAISIGRELTTSFGRKIDNLLITPAGELILVECKLLGNTQIHSMVAQLMLYAAEVYQERDAETFLERSGLRMEDVATELMASRGIKDKHRRDEAEHDINKYFRLRKPGLLLVTEPLTGSKMKREVQTVLRMLRPQHRVAHAEIARYERGDEWLYCIQFTVDHQSAGFDRQEAELWAHWRSFYETSRSDKVMLDPHRTPDVTDLLTPGEATALIRDVISELELGFHVSNEWDEEWYQIKCHFYSDDRKRHVSLFTFYEDWADGHRQFFEVPLSADVLRRMSISSSFKEIHDQYMPSAVVWGKTLRYDLRDFKVAYVDEISSYVRGCLTGKSLAV